MRLLFVCLGNICRSPAAEGIMRAQAPHLTIDSAGTGAWHIGDPPYGPMQAAAKARGVDLGQLRARLFRPDDFESFDLIIAMDRQNLHDIEKHRPKAQSTPVQLLAERDVPDPYYSRDFDGCLDMIEKACVRLLADMPALQHR